MDALVVFANARMLRKNVLSKVLAETGGEPRAWRAWHERLRGTNAVRTFAELAKHLRIGAARAAMLLLAQTLRLLHDRGAHDKRLTRAAYLSLGDPASGLNPVQNSVRRAADEAVTGLRPSADEIAALRDAFVPHLVRLRLDAGRRVLARPGTAFPRRHRADQERARSLGRSRAGRQAAGVHVAGDFTYAWPSQFRDDGCEGAPDW